MKRKYWLVFGVIQAIGIVAALDAIFLQFAFLMLVSIVMLLPGSLASVALYWSRHVGANWSLWTLGAIAVLANALLFSIASSLLTRCRKPK